MALTKKQYLNSNGFANTNSTNFNSVWKGDFVLVLNPNNEKRLMSKSEFYSIWNKDDNGYILVVLPNKIKKLNISYLLPKNF